MSKMVWEAEISTAADLLKALNDIAAQGYDLSVVFVQNGVGEDYGSVELKKTMLTDGSYVHDLRFFLDAKYA